MLFRDSHGTNGAKHWIAFGFMPDGSENWSETELVNGKNGYHVYADRAQQFGLTAGGHWASFKDWPHVQLSSASSPAGDHTLQEINDAMEQRFGP